MHDPPHSFAAIRPSRLVTWLRTSRNEWRAATISIMTEPLPDEAIAEIEHRLNQARSVAPSPWQAWLETRDTTGGESFVRFGGNPDVDNEMYLTVLLGTDRLTSPDPRLDLIVDFVGNAARDVQRLITEVRRLRKSDAQ